MSTNFFESIQEKKAGVIALANQAADFQWIDENHKKTMIEKINSDVLTIGVIGQMKCGKSTFLNSFVFEDDILPSATTPMTAALSVITYGEEKKVVADFYTKEEWEEQKMTASRNLDEVSNPLERSKIQAAQELVEKSAKLGSSLNSYLGTSREDQIGNLVEYVGADGRFVSITKNVTIYWPEEYLKGVEIVDTPGFNDPIVSREERTKEFLKRADVVLLMLYAGRPFDATDRDILFKNVKQCGIGRVLVGINKYDLINLEKESEEDIIKYVCEEIEKESKATKDDTLKEILKETTPITLSAGMALNSVLPLEKVLKNSEYKKLWDDACDKFEISSQSQMREVSHMDQLIEAIKGVLRNEKDKILFKKPINAVLEAGRKIQEENSKDIITQKEAVNSWGSTDEENEEKLRNIERATKKLNRKIDTLAETLTDEFKTLVDDCCKDMEDTVDQTCERLINKVDDVGLFAISPFASIDDQIRGNIEKLGSRTLPRMAKKLQDDITRKFKNSSENFLSDTENIFRRHLDNYELEGVIVDIKKKIEFEQEQIFAEEENGEGKDSNDYGIFDFIGDFVNGALLGLPAIIGSVLGRNEAKSARREYLREVSSSFNAKGVIDNILTSKDKIVKGIKDTLITNLLDPLAKQLEEVIAHKENREQKLQEAEIALGKAQERKEVLTKQMQTIQAMVNQFEC